MSRRSLKHGGQLSEPGFTIKERSWLAKAAAIKLGAQGMAIVFGNTIHLHNVRKEDFLQNTRWLKHELCHIRQFQHYGFFPFIYKYLLESMRNGYYNNKYEIEARNAELD